jgi:DNA-binding IclR family transcriptional regulator
MSTDYTNDGQRRILRLITTLKGNEVNGLAPSEIARLQGCSASVVTRDLFNLHAEGYAEQVPHSGHWRLSPQIVQIAIAFQQDLARAQDRLTDHSNRFSRT